MKPRKPIRSGGGFLVIARVLKHPLLWLGVQGVLVTVVLCSHGDLEPTIMPDTASYHAAAESRSMAEALSSYRTYGYPLFLNITGAVAKGYAFVPALHLLIYLGAVIIFWYAIRAYTSSGWLALAAASPLFYAHSLDLLSLIESDFLAVGLTLASLSCLVMVATKPRSGLWWAAMTTLLVASYQVRPACLFLVALVPLMGPALRLCRERSTSAQLLPWTAGLLVATLLPFLLFCGLRWWTVGHFGLVAFGGFQVVGTTSAFLTEEVVEQLPAAEHELARRILFHRQQLGLPPYTRGSETREWYSQWNTNIWTIAFNEAVMMSVEGRFSPARPRSRFIDFNQKFVDLSWAMIRLRPALYLKWVCDSFVVGVGESLKYNWVRWPTLALLVSLPFAAYRRRRKNLGATPTDLRVLGIFLLAISFFGSYIAMLSIAAIPAQRFLVCSILLLPSALCAGFLAAWKS